VTDELVASAKELAARAHATQRRKVGDLPYFSHLEAVAQLLIEHGHAAPELLAGAYLHDLLEDQPAFAAELRARLPALVVEMVEALSEPKCDASGQRLPKAVRFEAYFARVSQGSRAAELALPISCADKVHNTRSLIDAEAHGVPLLSRLNTRPGEQLLQLERLRTLYAGHVAPSLLLEYDAVRAALATTVERWLFGRAVQIAAEAHLSQFDRAGEPYILHPLRLALRAGSRDEQIVSVLHDVVEDSPWQLSELEREGFPERVLHALDALTKREHESYHDFIERVAANGLATRVKLLDLEHNSDLSRLPSPTDQDRARVEKYQRASQRLLQVLAKGDK